MIYHIKTLHIAGFAGITLNAWRIEDKNIITAPWKHILEKMQNSISRYFKDARSISSWFLTLSWLVAFRPTPLKNDGVKVSWDDFSIPNMMGKSFKTPWFQSPPISWLELRAALRLARPASFGSSISAISTVRWGASFFPDAEHRNRKAREPNKLHVEVFLKKNVSWLVYGNLEDHDIDCRNLVCRSLIAPPIGVTTSSRDGGRNMYWVYCNNPTRWATASYKMLQVSLWTPWKNIWCRKQSINNVVIGNIE